MKIVYIHQYFRTPQMSGGTRSYEMARRWVAKGHSVHIVTSDSDRHEGGWRTYEVDGISVHACAVPYSNAMTFGRRIRAFGRFAVAASVRARRLRGDVVFATSTPLTIIVPAMAATALRRTPIVFEVRDLWPELPIAVGALNNRIAIALARAMEFLAYRAASRVVTLSPGMTDGVVRRGFPAERIVIAPNSCDIGTFDVAAEVGQRFRRSQSQWLGDRPLVVYCGTLGKINNVSYLVDVARSMLQIDPRIAFAVFGRGADEKRIAERAEELGVLGRNLFIKGEVPKSRMPEILSAADVCTSLFLPLKEMEANSANKFFDALAAGRPVAVNYGGWQADLLTQTGAGIAISAVDHETAARELAGLMADPERRAAAGKAAARLARDRFDRDVVSDRVLTALCDAAREVEVRNGRRGAWRSLAVDRLDVRPLNQKDAR